MCTRERERERDSGREGGRVREGETGVRRIGVEIFCVLSQALKLFCVHVLIWK